MFAGILKGTGRETWTIIATVTGLYAVGIPLEWVFGFTKKMGSEGLWLGYLFGLGATMIFFLVLMFITKWDKPIKDFGERMIKDKEMLDLLKHHPKKGHETPKALEASKADEASKTNW